MNMQQIRIFIKGYIRNNNVFMTGCVSDIELFGHKLVHCFNWQYNCILLELNMSISIMKLLEICNFPDLFPFIGSVIGRCKS